MNSWKILTLSLSTILAVGAVDATSGFAQTAAGANAGPGTFSNTAVDCSQAEHVDAHRPPASVVPEPVNEDSWMAQHNALVKRAHKGGVDVLFLGDSITAGMNQELLHKYFGAQACNFGIPGDRTQHLLWRLQNGELDFEGKQPRVSIILIGINNFGAWQNLPASTNQEICSGIKANVEEACKRLPRTKILVLGILPSKQNAKDKTRERTKEINAKLRSLANNKHVWFADIGSQLLEPDGTISPEVMPDFLHPSQEIGYERMFKAIKPYVEQIEVCAPR